MKKHKTINNPPLFSGKGQRDAAVSEWEKMADAANTIFLTLIQLLQKRKQ